MFVLIKLYGLFNCSHYEIMEFTLLSELWYSDTQFRRIYSLVSTVFISGIPFLMLLVFNLFIICTLRNRKMEFKPQNLSEVQEDQMKEKSKQHQITVTLVTVSFALLVFTVPHYMYYALYPFFAYDISNNGFGQQALAETLIDMWYVLNNCANIFLYCASGKKFRDDLTTIFKQICQGLSTANSNLL